ncbi:MAG: SPOR domain-containing protein [Alphaproteobacteria bacterium]|nr:SPOR domain-containing protein [Alphaproteobacteria bacterium]
MSQDKQFHQYGYDHYLKAPRKRRRRSSDDGFFEKPVVKYSALGLVLILLGTVIILSYPSGQDENLQIPIVQADLRPVKAIPEDPQGMDIPFQDNTFYATLGDSAGAPEEPPEIQNLFSENNEDNVIDELMTKEEALEEATSLNPYDSVSPPEEFPEEPSEVLESSEVLSQDILQKIEKFDAELESLEAVEADTTEAEEVSIREEILQKVKSPEIRAFEGRVASAAIAPKPKLHAAATSPDTLEFVRNVLNKEAKQDEESLANINPAAGVITATPVNKGQYFVQLASITDSSRAAAEYKKLQGTFLVLTALPYRVQEANLPSGTFYRIQTGPFSKEQAEEICSRIKDQKPGGCLVVR